MSTSSENGALDSSRWRRPASDGASTPGLFNGLDLQGSTQGPRRVPRADTRPTVATASSSTVTRRAYDSVAWRDYRLRFRQRQIRLGIAPVCGSTLPGGPDLSAVSRCKQAGRLTDRRLQLHHSPRLLDGEHADMRAVCSDARVGWLCPSCHSRATAADSKRSAA